jgi:hypothetical protein
MGIAQKIPEGVMHRDIYLFVAIIHVRPRQQDSGDLGTGKAEQYPELPLGEEGTFDGGSETPLDDLPVFFGAVLERHEFGIYLSSSVK